MSNPPTYNISGEPPSPPPPKSKSRVFSLFLVGVIMISILFTFFIFLGLLSVILLPILLPSLHRRRRRQSSVGFSSKRVKKLPQFKFSEPKLYGSDCVVCLDEFKQGQWCRRLPSCGHVFHRKCVDSWLLKAITCPICRVRVRFGDEDSQEEEFRRYFDHRRSSLVDL